MPQLPQNLWERLLGNPEEDKSPRLICTFSGENPDIRFDDWLSALDQVSSWNEWPKQEALLQLAGYLRGRALQEWNFSCGTTGLQHSS